MKKSISTLLMLFCLVVSGQNGYNTPLLAHPGAIGPGGLASGGRGGVLGIVTTLSATTGAATYVPASGGDDEYYTGSLFQLLATPAVGPIVFNLSGNIVLPNSLDAPTGDHNGVSGTVQMFSWPGMPGVNNKTVYGQSAPQGGITVTNGAFRFDGAAGDNKNIIFRYFRSRPVLDRDGETPGYNYDDAFTWALAFSGGGDSILVDHMSFSFSHDKNLGFTTSDDSQHGAYRFTASHSLLADGGTNAYSEINPNQLSPYPNPENRTSYHAYVMNLMAYSHRTPNMAFSGLGQVANNVLFDIPNRLTTFYHNINLNWEKNYVRAVNTGDGGVMANRFSSTGTPVVFAAENIFEGASVSLPELTGSPAEDNQVIFTLFASSTQLSSSYFTGTRHTGMPNDYLPISAQSAFDQIVTAGDVGAYKYLDDNGDVQVYRDSFDSGVLAGAASGTKTYTSRQTANWVLPTTPANTRPGTYDTDNDGMADAWEIKVFGNLSQSYRGDFDGDGYENIEEYMMQVDLGNSPALQAGGTNAGKSGPLKKITKFIN